MARRFAARLASREIGLLNVILAVALGIRLLGVSQGLPYLQWYLIHATGFQLPNHPGLTPDDIHHICEVVLSQ